MFDKKKGAFLSGVLLLAVTATAMKWEIEGGPGCVAAATQVESTVRSGRSGKPEVEPFQADACSLMDSDEWKKIWEKTVEDRKTEGTGPDDDSLFAGMSLVNDSFTMQGTDQDLNLQIPGMDNTKEKTANKEPMEIEPVKTQADNTPAPVVQQAYQPLPAGETPKAPKEQNAEKSNAEEQAAPEPDQNQSPQTDQAAEQPPTDGQEAQEAQEALAVPVNGYGGLALSEADYAALERIVQAEAGGEDQQGKILVAQVVLNRVLDENFADTAEGVILEKIGGSAQFSPTVDGRYYSVTVTQESKDAVYSAINGEDISQGALYFSARSKANPNDMQWFDRNLTWLFQYGGHEFYTLP